MAQLRAGSFSPRFVEHFRAKRIPPPPPRRGRGGSRRPHRPGPHAATDDPLVLVLFDALRSWNWPASVNSPRKRVNSMPSLPRAPTLQDRRGAGPAEPADNHTCAVRQRSRAQCPRMPCQLWRPASSLHPLQAFPRRQPKQYQRPSRALISAAASSTSGRSRGLPSCMTNCGVRAVMLMLPASAPAWSKTGAPRPDRPSV